MNIPPSFRDDGAAIVVFSNPAKSPEAVTRLRRAVSYGQKLVTRLSGGVLDLLYPVLERHSLNDFGEVV